MCLTQAHPLPPSPPAASPPKAQAAGPRPKVVDSLVRFLEPGVRGTLVWLVLAVLSPLSVFSAVQIHAGIHGRVQQRLQDDMNYAKAVQMAFANYVRGVWAAELVIGAAITRTGVPLSPTAIDGLLNKALPDYPTAECLSWLGPNGTVIASTQPAAVDLALYDRDYFQRVLQGEDRVVSDLLISRVTNVPTVIIERAIRSPGGELLGVIIVGEDARKLGAALPATSMGAPAFGLVDRQRTLVYVSTAPNLSVHMAKVAADAPAVAALGGARLTSSDYRSWDGQMSMGAAVPVPTIGWAAYAETPVAAVLGQARRAAARAALTMLLVACGSVAVAIWIGNRLVRPMRALERAAAAIAGGDSTARVGLKGHGELARVTQMFDLMARSIQEAQEQLRQRAAQQEIVARLGQRALAGADLSALMEEAVAATIGVLGVDYGMVCEAQPEDGSLRPCASFGSEHAAGGPTGPNSGPRPGALVVTIPGRHGPFGVLALHARGPQEFTADDTHFAQAVANLIAIAVDRRRADDQLSESNERFRTLVHTAPVPIITTDDFHVTSWNPAAERVFGWKAEEVLGQRVPFVPDDQWAEARERQVRLYSGAEPMVQSVVRRHRRDGTALDFVAATARLVDSVGGLRGEITVYVDITDRNRFLQVAAHELRNPMAGVKSAMALMRRRHARGADAADTGRLAEMAEREVDRLGGLLTEILDAFRLQEGRLELKPQRVDLADVVASAVRPYKVTGDGAPRVAVEVTGDGPMWVVGDYRRLEEVVRNLLSNAAKYSPPSGEVRVTVTRGAGQVRVSVADQGVGIPPDQLDRIFEQFYRATNLDDAGDPGGLGLGLFICRDIVRRHGGRIWAESVLGQGATFHFELPLAE